LTGTIVVPDPTDCTEVVLLVARVGSVPHSNQALVARPFGVTFPLRDERVAAIEFAARAVTAGGIPPPELSPPPPPPHAETAKDRSRQARTLQETFFMATSGTTRQ
jgi:hypothetical protein